MNWLKKWMGKSGLLGVLLDIIVTAMLLRGTYARLVLGQERNLISAILVEFIILLIWTVVMLKGIGFIKVKIERVKD